MPAKIGADERRSVSFIILITEKNALLSSKENAVYIDGLFTGVQVEDVTPVMVYSDGKRTDEQEKDGSGVPLWHVTSAMRSGAYVLPCRVKIATHQPPEAGRKVRFSGVQAYAWKQNNIAWTAESVSEISADSGQNLSEIFADTEEK